MGGGASTENYSQLPEAEASVVRRYNEYRSKIMGESG
jgi:hypothetical protein